jgi:RNA polymerase sigma-70 factor (ECF subfamily)
VRPELRHADLSEEQVNLITALSGTEDEASPDRALVARDLVEYLLTSLKPAERLVVDLLYLQQRSVAEIKEITGWSAAHVKVRAFRARKKLKDRLATLEAQEKYGPA